MTVPICSALYYLTNQIKTKRHICLALVRTDRASLRAAMPAS